MLQAIFSMLLGVLRFIFRSVVTWLERLLCRNAYEISTLHQKYEDLFSVDTRNLGNLIEYRLFLNEYLGDKKQINPSLQLKPIGDQAYKKLVLSIKTSNNHTTYAQTIALYDVSESIISVSLPSIPFKYLKNVCPFTTLMLYKYVEVGLIEAFDEADNQICLTRCSVYRFSVFDVHEIGSGDAVNAVEKWGKVYRLKFIEQQSMRLGTDMFSNRVFYYIHKKCLVHFGLRGRHILFRLNFWRYNLFSGKQITAALEEWYLLRKSIHEDW